ncbi:hypothetical protein BJ166DRAFT_59398 [Pestalotiopsis sp. NC0098]|nr:hypothetical protein BJ166DRAFT_59398 [Pestalotiopsis sp. NC0098]
MARIRGVVLLLASYLFTTVAAVDPVTLALQTYPTCAIACLAELVPKSACELTDVDCLCTDAPLNSQLTVCVTAGCSTQDALATKNGSATLCGEPVRNVSVFQGMVGIVGCSITFVIFLVRIASNMSYGGGGLGWDVYLITAAMACTIVASTLAPVSASYGVGRDIWTLSVTDIEMALFYFLIAELFYFAAVGLAKASILVFMLRIFPLDRFRIAVFVTIGLVAAYTLAFILATTFQCQPVSYFWKQLDDAVEGRCNNINAQAWISAAVNIVLDLVVLALPLRPLWALQLSVARKLTVIAMFSLGIFVTIISAIRMHTFIVFSSSVNFTWDYKDGGTWSLVELYASITCACLPALRVLAALVQSRWRRSSKYANTGSKQSHGSTLSGKMSSKKGNNSSRNQGDSVWMDESDCVDLMEIKGGDKKAVASVKSSEIQSDRHSEDQFDPVEHDTIGRAQ